MSWKYNSSRRICLNYSNLCSDVMSDEFFSKIFLSCLTQIVSVFSLYTQNR